MRSTCWMRPATHRSSPPRSLALRTSLARASMAVHGYGVEVEEAFKTALAISQTAGTAAQQYPVLRALATYYMGVANFEQGAVYGQRLLDLGES